MPVIVTDPTTISESTSPASGDVTEARWGGVMRIELSRSTVSVQGHVDGDAHSTVLLKRCELSCTRIRSQDTCLSSGAGEVTCSHAIYRRDRGNCLFAKWLEHGRFVWPRTDGGIVALTSAQLGLLLEKFAWRQPVDAARPRSAL
jgi:hypothetical protein